MRRVRTILAAAATAVFLCLQLAAADPEPTPTPTPEPSTSTSVEPSAPPSTPPPAPTPWGDRADDLITRALAASTTGATAANHASLAEALGRRRGWSDPATTAALAQVMAMRLPDGGWGLPYAWDAYQDASINPANTTYTVSLVAVGEVLLQAYVAGVVDKAVISGVLSRLYAIPRLAVSGGYCLSYSSAAADNQPTYCVHNVNAGVGAFLVRAQRAGMPPATWWMSMITKYEVTKYDPNARDWRYMDGGSYNNDPAHTGYNVASLQVLAPPIAAEATAFHIGTNLTNPNDVWLHMSLAPYACAQAAQWLTEVDTEFAKPGNSTFGLLVQAAALTAQAAAACDPPPTP